MAAYFLFFAELPDGESHARFAILLSFQSNEQRIRRLITPDLQITWGGQPIKFDLKRQAQTRLFTETKCKKYVVVTLQAQACSRKRPIRNNCEFFHLDFVEIAGDRVSRAGVREI